MREIKFRVWKERHGVGEFEEGGFMFVPKDNFVYELNNSNIHWKVMQFTGLHDKHGKEIYEGDVVSTKRNGEGILRNGVVGYDENICAFYIGDFGMLSDYAKYELFEIIGNIYENPDLLTNK